MGSSAPADYAQVTSVAARLHAMGARFGAGLVLANASLAAKREAAEAGDLPERPAFGRRVQPTENLNPANDHASTSQPAPLGTGL